LILKNPLANKRNNKKEEGETKENYYQNNDLI